MSLKDELRKISANVDAGLPPCTACTNDVTSSDAVQVFGLPYHRACLACSRCKRRLEQHDIAEHKSRPVCMNCSAFYQGKTCDRCGEGAAHAVSALGKRFCKTCFVCAGCGQAVSGEFVEEEGRPYHENCVKRAASGAAKSDSDPSNAWDIMKSSEEKSCHGCRRTVPLGEGLSVKIESGNGRAFFHEECFKCSSCHSALRGAFVQSNGGFFCQRCGDKQDAKPAGGDPCAKCQAPLAGKISRALGKSYHADCFVCSKCSSRFPNGEFVDVNGKPTCERCA